MKESKYVRLANTIYRVLRNSRIPLFLHHRKSDHLFSVWQYMVLLTVRQYQAKSYRMFAEWLVEAYYLRMFLQLSLIPHYTTLQKFSSRINGTLLEKIISSFILLLLNVNTECMINFAKTSDIADEPITEGINFQIEAESVHDLEGYCGWCVQNVLYNYHSVISRIDVT